MQANGIRRRDIWGRHGVKKNIKNSGLLQENVNIWNKRRKKSRGQPANPGSPVRWPLKRRVRGVISALKAHGNDGRVTYVGTKAERRWRLRLPPRVRRRDTPADRLLERTPDEHDCVCSCRKSAHRDPTPSILSLHNHISIYYDQSWTHSLRVTLNRAQFSCKNASSP